MRGTRTAALLLAAAGLFGAALGPAAAPAAVAAPAADGAAGPTSVEVPFRGQVELSPAEGWSYVDCEGTRAATPLVASCTAEGLTLSAPRYDPGLGRVRVPVTIERGTTTLAVDYLATLGRPPAPTARSGALGRPVAAGQRVLLPLSDLGVACADCATGGRLQALGVEPATVGTLSATPTHLVLTTAPDAIGPATLSYRVVDAVGTVGETAELEVVVVRPVSRLVALHAWREVDEPVEEIDLTTLVASSARGDVTLLGCGTAVSGSVRCTADGRASYVAAAALPGRDGLPADQFSFHVVDADGEQATGSVTLTGPPADSGVVDGALVRAVGGDDAELGVAVAVPPPASTELGGSSAGVLDPLRALLDRTAVP